MPKKVDLTGQVFGYLTVVKEAPAHRQSERTIKIKWECQCKCGKIVEVQAGNLTKTKNATKSCGCLLKERPQCKERKTHGLANHPLYKVWMSMNRRCQDPNDNAFKYYGAKGVYICPEWHRDNPKGLQNFINDMEASYVKGYELDKDIKAVPNRAKSYSKDTCIWASPLENQRASSNTKLDKETVEYIKKELAKGKNLTELAKKFKVHPTNIRHIQTGRSWSKV